jgi:hypothetical protein
MEVGRRPWTQPEAAGDGETGSLGDIVLHPPNFTGCISAMQKERVQVELDRVNGREAEGSPRQGLAGSAELLQMVRSVAVLVREQADFAGTRKLARISLFRFGWHRMRSRQTSRRLG